MPPNGSSSCWTSRLQNERYVLQLYITGMSPRSLAALTAIDTLCRELEGRYSLEVIDVSEHPQLAMDEQITAPPMLARKQPPSLGVSSGTQPIRKPIRNGCCSGSTCAPRRLEGDRDVARPPEAQR